MELTDALVELLDTHAFDAAGVPDPVNVIVASTQTLLPPLIMGNRKRVTSTSSVAIHPLPSTPTTVYVVVDEGANATLFWTLLFQLIEVVALL